MTLSTELAAWSLSEGGENSCLEVSSPLEIPSGLSIHHYDTGSEPGDARSRENSPPSIREGRSSSPPSPRRKQKGCIVEIWDAANLPPSVFEATEIGEMMPTRKCAFDRSGTSRNSVLLKLGQHPEQRSTASIGSVAASHYVKTSNDFITWMYLAIVIGPGILNISKALSLCGLFPGFCGLLFFTLGHIFVCHRIVEIPRLVQQNLETFSDIAKACFGTGGWGLVWFFSVSGWFCACYVYAAMMQRDYVVSFFGCGWEGYLFAIFCGAFLTALVLRTSNDGLWLCAKLSLGSMVAATSTECACAIFQGMIRDQPFRMKAIGTPAEIVQGFSTMSLSFAGACIIPYLVSEIVDPQTAKAGLTRACWIACSVYCGVGLICYFGWGDFDKGGRDVFTTLGDLGYSFSVRVMGVSFIVKTMTSYPIFFWPLCREIESYWKLEEFPEVELRLPWAVRHVKLKRMILRIVMVFLTLCPFLLPKSVNENLFRFVVNVPIFNFFFGVPMLLALGAIYVHHKILRTRNSEPLLANPGTVDMPYFAKNWIIHIITTACVSGVVFVACTLKFVEFIKIVSQDERRMNSRCD